MENSWVGIFNSACTIPLLLNYCEAYIQFKIIQIYSHSNKTKDLNVAIALAIMPLGMIQIRMGWGATKLHSQMSTEVSLELGRTGVLKLGTKYVRWEPSEFSKHLCHLPLLKCG